MARIRSIKPQFWTSEQVAECSPNARLLFIGLWSFCDDGGVHPASEMRLKMEVFPADPFSRDDMTTLINELITVGLLSYYRVDGRGFWRVSGWNHQKIDQPTYYHPGPDGIIPKGPARRRKRSESSPNSGRSFGECSPQEKEKEGEGDTKKTCPKSDKAKKVRADKESGFNEFWEVVAAKVKRKEALDSWVKHKCAEKADQIIDTYVDQLTNRLQYQDATKIPMPSTWLNNHQWEDEGYAEINYQPPGGTNANETNKSIYKTRNQSTADAITQAVVADYKPTVCEDGGNLRDGLAKSVPDDRVVEFGKI